MKRFAWSCALLLGLGLRAGAQVPIGPPPTAVAPVAPVDAAAAQPKTIWSFLGISCDKLRECHLRCCQTPLGEMVNSMLAPLRMGTGGLVREWCPSVPTAEELASMAPGEVSPAEAAAAKIKADEAGAAARRAAVKYLGTVDCHWYPEAELALIAALRADRNECVRLEAAFVLGRGCCCTKRTIEALNIVITGSDRDGNPIETSERVKICALESLQNCMLRGVELPTPEPPELPPAVPLDMPRELPASLSYAKESRIHLAAHDIHSAQDQAPPIPAAHESIAVSSQPRAGAGAARPRFLPTGSRSLAQLLAFTRRSARVETMPASAVEARPALVAPVSTAPAPPSRRINLQPIGMAPTGILP